jgi:hypothetical protein
MWQSKVPRPYFPLGFSTCDRILATTGGPNVRLGTKWPSLRCLLAWRASLLQSAHPQDGTQLAARMLELNEGVNRREDAYMISTWSQSAPCSIVLAQSAPSCAKSAERMEGAMMALGAMVGKNWQVLRFSRKGVLRYKSKVLQKIALKSQNPDSSRTSRNKKKCPRGSLTVMVSVVGVGQRYNTVLWS